MAAGLGHFMCCQLLCKFRVRDNVWTVSWREGIPRMNVEKHCCSHSTGTAEAAMQTHSHCSLCLGMLPLRLKDNNSFSLSVQYMAFLWRWVPVSSGCVGASYNGELLYPWLCSLYSSSHWKGKNCWSSWPQNMDTAGKSEHVQPKQHMKYICFSKTGFEKAAKHCQPAMQTWQSYSCCISGKEAFVFHVLPFRSTHCPENLLLNTASVTKVEVHK